MRFLVPLLAFVFAAAAIETAVPHVRLVSRADLRPVPA
eukprot:CAMPEP_0173322688 /NCGR_PEP_ID=MMETSP1143-20121109/30104_1 /TAXON_ID=483371 /ORGANISM="non described non described, Strain CCMP2298" /LENGTH=37 /DNA_ID= /DNA_START= /DNA_END= /DNA_ORIENTATION=